MGKSVDTGWRKGWEEAIAHWLTGLIFAGLLSAVVVASAHRAPWIGGAIAFIEEIGVDLTMRLHADMFGREPIGIERHGPADGHRPAPRGYLFIDLDAQTCRDAEGDARCDRRSPASPGAAARVANALIDPTGRKSPRVIIIDARLWDNDPTAPIAADVLTLLRLTADPASPPVLASAPALPFEPGAAPGAAEGHGQPRVLVDWSLAPACLRDSGIHFAPALLWPDPVDGIARRYPSSVAVRVFEPAPAPKAASSRRDAEGGVAPRPCPTPADPDAERRGGRLHLQHAATLPYLAALYADETPATRARLKCAGVDVGPTAGGRCAALAHAAPEGSETAHAEPPRTFFTIGSDSLDALKTVGRYEGYAAQQILTSAGALRLPRDDVDDRIVVIGYSGANGLDRHATPLGEMAGAQIILNAARSFATRTDLKTETLPKALWREAVVAGFSSLPFLLFWWIKGRLWGWANGGHAPHPGGGPRTSGVHGPPRRLAYACRRLGDRLAASSRSRRPRRARAQPSQHPPPSIEHPDEVQNRPPPAGPRRGAAHAVASGFISFILGVEDKARWFAAQLGFPVRCPTADRRIADRRLVIVVLRRFGAGGLIIAVFALTVAGAAMLATAVVAFGFARSLARGAPVDALLPLAVLILESFAHAAKYVIDGLHNEIEIRVFHHPREPHHDA